MMANKKALALFSADHFFQADQETKALRKKIHRPVAVGHINDIRSIRAPMKP